MKAALYATILAVCLAQVFALDCYSCRDCSLSGVFAIVENQVTCPSKASIDFLGATEPACLKQVESDGTVNRGCTTQTDCLAVELDKCDTTSEVGCAICCHTDRCNGAGLIKMTWTAIIFAMGAAILATRF